MARCIACLALALLAASVRAEPAAQPAPSEPAAAPAARPKPDTVPPAQAAQPPPVRLEVRASGLKEGGKLEIMLFSAGDGFPDKGQKAKARVFAPILKGQATHVFDDLAPGEYAVSCCHDENGNGKCDSNFLGIPKEGVACSNDAHQKNMIPKWEKAKVTAQAGDRLVVPVANFKY